MWPPTDLSSDFDRAPFLVIWETTRACALKCLHCRAEAIDRRHPDELSPEQAFRLIEEIRRFGSPLFILTGGDPLRRPDIFDIVAYASMMGLRTALTPSATPGVTYETLKRLKQNRLARLAVSLDGSTAAIHDGFRQVRGSYGWTLEIMRSANELGLSLQINTTVTKNNRRDLLSIAALLEDFRVELWSVFFLVPMGRASLDQEIGAVEHEEVFHEMARLARRSSFDIKSTEAPQYRRVLLETKKRETCPPEEALSEGSYTWANACRPKSGVVRGTGVNDGKGFVFVSHTGEIYPSGFLPLSAGNVKKDSLVSVYRESPLFTDLRDASKLKGKCGACEYKNICGGSRSRAYAVHGDPFAADPFCVHVPRGYEIAEEEKAFW